jgi:cytoskeletal protein CcmA (bactofilin family)
MSFWQKSEEIIGFLDHGTNITGELQFANTLRIDGNFHGSIASEDMLIIGEQAVVHAEIKVGDIEIYGQVFGNVEATGKAEIYSSGRLQGDIKASVLIIQAGAVLDGRSHVTSGVQQGFQEVTHLSPRPRHEPEPTNEPSTTNNSNKGD